MQKRFLKYFLILAALAGGTMIFLYAQKGYIFHKPAATGSGNEKQEEAEDIGTPTSDDPWKEMDKLVTAYYNKNGASFKGTVKLIDDNDEQEKIIEEHSFEYAVLSDNFYYSLDKIEVVQKKDMLLVVDHINKLISMSSLSGISGKTQKLFDIGEFKKLMEERKADAKVTQLGAEKILTIENIQDPQVQGYRIYYDPQTFRISKMLMGMQRLTPLDESGGNGIEEIPAGTDEEKSEKDSNAAGEDAATGEAIETYTYYLEIIYAETAVLNVSEKTFNPENKFVTIKNKTAELTKPYSGYQLIINSKETEKEIQKNSEQQ